MCVVALYIFEKSLTSKYYKWYLYNFVFLAKAGHGRSTNKNQLILIGFYYNWYRPINRFGQLEKCPYRYWIGRLFLPKLVGYRSRILSFLKIKIVKTSYKEQLKN